MKSRKSFVAIGVALAIGGSHAALAIQQNPEDDSVYEYGRWAVLSPAAGGTEPYLAALTPDAVNNARPEDAEDYDREIIGGDGPAPVEVTSFCTPGAPCGYATYYKNSASNGTVSPAAVPEGFDLSDQNPDGPVLANFSLDQVDVPAAGGSGVDPNPITHFGVTDTGNPDFADVNSVVNGAFVDGGSDLTGTQGSSTIDSQQMVVISDSMTANLSHSNQDTSDVFDFNGVDAGYWQQVAQRQVDSILNGTSDTQVLSDFDGYFVHGTAATLDQMQTFAAGHVTATYSGFVLDYASPVELNFDFGDNSWNGSFASANGFVGFNMQGGVDGANFSGTDASREVIGSFFNGGNNASGAVNNGSQLGVFSTDLQNSTVEVAR